MKHKSDNDNPLHKTIQNVDYELRQKVQISYCKPSRIFNLTYLPHILSALASQPEGLLSAPQMHWTLSHHKESEPGLLSSWNALPTILDLVNSDLCSNASSSERSFQHHCLTSISLFSLPITLYFLHKFVISKIIQTFFFLLIQCLSHLLGWVSHKGSRLTWATSEVPLKLLFMFLFISSYKNIFILCTW